MQSHHQGPYGQETSFQLVILTYLRFVLSGDLAGAWRNFGFLVAQMALLSIAAAENAMTAMAYGRPMRMAIETNARKRISADQVAELIGMLTEEHGPAEKTILREIYAGLAEKKTAEKVTIGTVLKDGDHLRRRKKGKCNMGQKGKGYMGN